MKSLAALVETWKSKKLRTLPPEPIERVIASFERFGIRPSKQVCELYSMIGGFEVLDDNMWQLWSLEQIEAEFPDDRIEHGVLFSDYLMSCWCFRLKPTEHSEMAVVLDEFDVNHPPYVVASNLESFFDAMISNPDSVLDLRRPAQQVAQEGRAAKPRASWLGR